MDGSWQLFDFDWMILAQNAKNAKVAASGITLFLSLLPGSAGLVAIAGGACFWASEKTDHAGIWASIAAFTGGVWSGFSWFGWPFVTSEKILLVAPPVSTWLSSTPAKFATVTESSFSIFALFGNIFLGVVGFFALFLIMGVIAPEIFKESSDIPSK